MKLLVVSAHPGDEILGCGGTLALHVRRGHEVRALVLGDGLTSRVRSIEKAKDLVDLGAIEEQARAALKEIGVEQVRYLRLPDNRFDTVPLLDLVKVVEASKKGYAPDIVYTNSIYDLSVDQRKTARAVGTAFRPLPGEHPAEILSFESPSSTEWNMTPSGRSFSPDSFVDISETLNVKLKAFEHIAFEVRAWPHHRSIQSIEHLNRSRGAAVGVDAAEAFVLQRAVRVLN